MAYLMPVTNKGNRETHTKRQKAFQKDSLTNFFPGDKLTSDGGQ